MRVLWSFGVLATGLLVVVDPVGAVVGGAPASAPEPDAAVVFTQRHGRSARIEGLKDERLGYYSFFGIRYAEPPMGIRRFQRPVRRLLAGEFNATSPCSKCPQPDSQSPQQVIGHEDCLCLNVFSPKMPGEEKGSPVIFFIHGGNYRTGSAAPYGGKHLTQEDTILVVPQYRLGSLGFITNGQKEATGNAGLFDLHVALTWVKEYIEFFGGDPTRVTVMGQGSGGSAASLMALSSEGRNNHGVVALSGTALSPGAVRSDPAKHTRELAKRTDCPESPIERLVICLRMQPVEKIILADNSGISSVDAVKFLEDISGKSGAGARVEGEDDKRGLPTLITELPSESLKKKKQKVPMLTGVNTAETVQAVFGKYSKTLVSSLQKTSDFIKKEIIGGLSRAVENVQGLLPIKKGDLRNIPILGNFEEYYNRLAQNGADVIQGLSSIAEVTGDALFNFPAFKSVQEWGAAAPAYLYSFEFSGNLTKASHFLPGVPLAAPGDRSVMEKAKNKGPAHGDELAYIFEPLNDDGTSIETEPSQMDARVRKNFLGVISKFTHDLGLAKKNTSVWSSFFSAPKDTNSYIRIGEDLTMDKDFRFCQMGLWGNMVDRLTSSLCQNEIKNLLKLVPLPTELNPISLLNPITNLKPAQNILKPSQNILPKQPQELFPSVTKWLLKK